MVGLALDAARAASVTLPPVGSWWHQVHHLIPIGFVGAISWSVWLVRFTLSRLYRPVPVGYFATTSVIVPAYREDPGILSECLDSWLAENPTEVIVVPDLEDTEVIARLDARAARDRRLRVLPFAHHGKRSALGLGIRRAAGEVLVLADSDTRWEPGLLLHVLAPYASWWRVEGFTVQGGQKGVMADGADHDLLDGLYVHGTGDEAIHLRSASSDDTISHDVVRDTGLLRQSFGEGLYVGSAHKNWCKYSGCQPDRSDDDVLTGNNIADTTAENIDIKEGTTGGKITGNQFNGTGMAESAATGWINVKGNGWLIQGNTGVNSVKNGYQVHQVYPGWGIGNVFTGNRAQVNGPGYGIYVQSKRLQTVVSCNNVVSAAGQGLSSIACSSS